MRKCKVIQDQAEKSIVAGAKAPAQMLPARSAIHDIPCITWKPGKFFGWLTAFQATAYGAETTDVKPDAVGIDKAVGMAPGDGYTFLVMRDYLSAGAAKESFFGQGNS